MILNVVTTNMNKYIKTDLRDAAISMKIAIMNALNDIDKGEETYINLGKYISYSLFIDCLEEAEWSPEKLKTLKEEINMEAMLTSPSGKVVVIIFGPEYILSARKNIKVTLSFTLSSTQEIEVPGDFDVNNNELLQKEALMQIYTPVDALKDTCFEDKWEVDDICVI